jgi:hypothetical protein
MRPRVHLLSVCELRYNRSHGRLTITHLAYCGGDRGRSRGRGRQGVKIDWDTVRRPVSVIEVVEVSAQTLPPNSRATQGKAIVRADREAAGVNGACLGRVVELKLVVGGDVSRPTGLV